MRIVTICGSAGLRSANRAALNHAGSYLLTGTDDLELVAAEMDAMPVFDVRLADDPPASVTALSAELQRADGVLIAAPEYAAGLAGGTKSALDWMVGLAALYHRPVCVLSAGSTGGPFAIEQLVRTLSWQGALVVDTLGVAAPRTKIDTASGEVSDPDLAQSIERWADRLTAAIAANPAQRMQRVAEVISPFGIDPARFGDVAKGRSRS